MNLRAGNRQSSETSHSPSPYICADKDDPIVSYRVTFRSNISPKTIRAVFKNVLQCKSSSGHRDKDSNNVVVVAVFSCVTNRSIYIYGVTINGIKQLKLSKHKMCVLSTILITA